MQEAEGQFLTQGSFQRISFPGTESKNLLLASKITDFISRTENSEHSHAVPFHGRMPHLSSKAKQSKRKIGNAKSGTGPGFKLGSGGEKEHEQAL